MAVKEFQCHFCYLEIHKKNPFCYKQKQKYIIFLKGFPYSYKYISFSLFKLFTVFLLYFCYYFRVHLYIFFVFFFFRSQFKKKTHIFCWILKKGNPFSNGNGKCKSFFVLCFIFVKHILWRHQTLLCRLLSIYDTPATAK